MIPRAVSLQDDSQPHSNPSYPSPTMNTRPHRPLPRRRALLVALCLAVVPTLLLNPVTSFAGDSPKQAEGLDKQTLDNGVTLKVYNIGQEMNTLHEVAEGQKPNVVLRRKKIMYGGKAFGGLEKQFVAEVAGYLQAPSDGAYTFRLASDDGSAVWVGKRQVVSDKGLHIMRPRDAKVHLKKGIYPIRVLMFQNVGNFGLHLSWRTPGSEGIVPIPHEALWTTTPDPSTADGLKQLGAPVSS